MNEDDRKRLAEAYNRALRSGVPDMEARRQALAEVQGAGPGPSAGPVAPRTEVPAYDLGGLARSALQGATFGFGDEAVAGWRGIAAMWPGGKSPAEAVEESLASERTKLDAYREDNPVAAFAAELAGGVAGGVGAARALASRAPAVAGALAAKGRGLRGLARLAGSGAVAGGVAGAGTAEGDLTERARGAARGAAFGAGTGLAVGGLLAGARKIGTVAADVVPGMRSGLVPGVDATDDRARDLLVTALRRDDALDDVGQATGRLRGRLARAGDVPVTIMDLGDEVYAPLANTQGLGRVAAGMPGRAKTVMTRELQERAAGQGQRVQQIARSALNVSDDALEKADEIIAQRRASAEPLYREAYEAGAAIVDDKIVKEMDDPIFRKFYDDARAIIKTRDDVSLPPLFDADGAPNPVSLEALDKMKQEVDAFAFGRGSSENVALRNQARAVRARLGRILDRADELVPKYAEARASYAGDSALLNALEAGKDLAFKADDRIIARVINGTDNIGPLGRKIRTDAERDMFRLGALDRLRDNVAAIRGQTRDVAGRVFGSEKDMGTFRALFPNPSDYVDFSNRMRAELATGVTRNAVLVGSRTAPMAAEMADAGLEVAEDLVTTAANPSAGALKMGMRALGRRLKGQSEAAMTSLAPRLTAGTQNRADLLSLLDELDDYVARRMRSSVPRTAGQAAAAGVISARASGS